MPASTLARRLALPLSSPVSPSAAVDPAKPVVVALPDGATTTVFRLLDLQRGNPKLNKGLPYGYWTAGLSLIPARLSGRNLCPGSSPGCRAGCLNGGGKGGMRFVQSRRLAKALAWQQHPDWFRARLARELTQFARKCGRADLKPACRLNVFSDLAWERDAPELFAAPVQFYDYTAVWPRMRRFLAGGLPRNYTLCFSRKETNEARCREALAAGGTVGVVFAGHRPARFWGYRVLDGDAHDLRFLDVPGSVVGLSAKGKARADRTGFVVRTPELPCLTPQ